MFKVFVFCLFVCWFFFLSDSFIFGVGVDVVRVCCNLVELGIGFDMLMFVGVFGFVVVDVFNVIEVRRLFLGELY